MNPKVSVIIPVKDRRELLLRCLDSIRLQSHRPVEVIVVDNGSTDGTLLAARQWGNENAGEEFDVRILQEAKPGACPARNKGLMSASGLLTIFFDSDDTMRPNLMATAVREFERNPDAEIICWSCPIHELDGSLHVPHFNPGNPFEDHMINSLLRTQGFMARTKLFTDIGGWDESLPGWNDWELGVRILLRQPVIVGINEFLVDIYAQENSITGKDFSSKAGQWEMSLAAVRKDIVESDHPDKKRLLGIIAYRETILAAHYAREGEPALASKLLEDSAGVSSRNGSLPALSLGQKALLRFAYHYTRHGGRGAWRIIRHLF